MAVTLQNFPGPVRGTTVEWPWRNEYPVRLQVVVNWPFKIPHQGLVYSYGGREQPRLSDGCPQARYGTVHDNRECFVWLTLEGEVTEEIPTVEGAP